jgi:hypothetical protein
MFGITRGAIALTIALASVCGWSAHGATLRAKLLAFDGEGLDRFGNAVAISGNTAIVGAPFDDVSADDSGAAYVFVRSAAGWTLQAKLVPADGAARDYFGWSVALAGDRAVVGSVLHDAAESDAGAAYVFVRSGSAWTQEAKLKPPSGVTSGAAFGFTLALDAQTIAVGSVGDHGAADYTGSVYVFVRPGNAWTLETKLAAFDGTQYDRFGESVALSGDTILVGSITADPKGEESGAAYVYKRSGGMWSTQAKLVPADGTADAWFGSAATLAGDRAVIGAAHDDTGGHNAGAAYTFTRSGAEWIEGQKLIGVVEGGNFGARVAMSGDTLVVGAPFDASGSATVFVRTGSWALHGKILPAGASGGDEFGSALALVGDTLIVGAPDDVEDGAVVGSAAVFEYVGCTPNEEAILVALDDSADAAARTLAGILCVNHQIAPV